MTGLSFLNIKGVGTKLVKIFERRAQLLSRFVVNYRDFLTWISFCFIAPFYQIRRWPLHGDGGAKGLQRLRICFRFILLEFGQTFSGAHASISRRNVETDRPCHRRLGSLLFRLRRHSLRSQRDNLGKILTRRLRQFARPEKPHHFSRSRIGKMPIAALFDTSFARSFSLLPLPHLSLHFFIYTICTITCITWQDLVIFSFSFTSDSPYSFLTYDPVQVRFSACGQLAGASSTDPGLSSVVLLNSLTWKRIVEFPMTSSVFVGTESSDGSEKKKNNNNDHSTKNPNEARHPAAVVYKEVNK